MVNTHEVKYRTAMKSINKLNLSEDAREWVVACLDPYHDYQYQVEGLPDERTAPSVVQIHNQQATLSAPAAAGGGNWDANIVYTGFSTLMDEVPLQMTSVTGSGSGVDYSVAMANRYGKPFASLILATEAAGTSFAFGRAATAAATAGWSTLGSVKYSTDMSRVIGVAIEVHNTTADIYKQGSCTVAMLPDIGDDEGTCQYVNDAAGLIATYPPIAAQRDVSPVFASTVAALQTVPGASTWPAAKGVYAIPRMVIIPRRLSTFESITGGVNSIKGNALTRVPCVYDSNGNVCLPIPQDRLVIDPADGAGDSFWVPSSPNCSLSGFAGMQIFFTGLSNQTTLTVTFRTIVEYFPSVGSALLPLATPSPTFDVSAFRLYSEVVAKAPYAVPVSQNAGGDYFRKILQVIGAAAGAIAPFTGPFAPLVALGGRMANAGADLIKPSLPPRPVERMSSGPGSNQKRN